ASIQGSRWQTTAGTLREPGLCCGLLRRGARNPRRGPADSGIASMCISGWRHALLYSRVPWAGLLLAALLWCCSASAHAHTPLTSTGQQQLAALTSAVLLAGMWLTYLAGSRRRQPLRVQALLFHVAVLLCVFAL